MKTLAEFIQRLQNDPAFEKQAQTFDHGDDLIAFVKRQGYDFTLEQLMSEFERGVKLPAETGGLAPPPADVSASIPPSPDEAEFTRKPEALVSGDRATSLLETGNDDVTRDPPSESLSKPSPAIPTPADVSASIPPSPDEAEFTRKPEALSSPERGAALPKRGNDNFIREQPSVSLPQPKKAMPLPEAEEEPRAGLFRGGGGRHRGFSAQRLKHVSEEEP